MNQLPLKTGQSCGSAYQIGQHPGKLQIAYLFPEQDSFGIYYRKSDTVLGAALRSAIAALKQDGTMAKLAAKYKLPAADVK